MNKKFARSVTVFAALVFSVIIAIAMISQGAYGQQEAAAQTTTFGFTAPTNLSNDGNNAEYPWVSASGSNVYVAWTEFSHGIILKYSNNNGTTWSGQEKISPSGAGVGTANYPVMAANGSDVYATWTQVVSGQGTIYVASSTNNGTSFNMIPVSMAGANADIPFIAQYGSDAYVIWHQNTTNDFQSVWVSSSTNYGTTWSTPFNLDNGSGIAGSPQIAAYGNYAFATWNGGGAWFSESNNSGLNWSTPINVAAPNTQDVDSPWVSGWGSNVYITWNDNYTTGNYEPYIAVSNDNGSTWTPRQLLLSGAKNDYQVQVTAVGSNAYVIFRDHSSPYHTFTNSKNGSVFFEASYDNGTHWTPYYSTSPGDLANGSQGITGWADGVAVSGNDVGFAYLSGCSVGQYEPFPNSGNGDCNMYASYSNDSGTTFMPQIQLSTDFLAGPIRQISSSNYAMSGSNMYVAWQDNSTSNFQIYLSDTNLASQSTSSSTTSSTTSPSGTTIITTSSSSSSPTSTSSSSTSTSIASSSSTTQTTTSTPVKKSNFDLYAAIAAIVAVVVIASAVLLYRRSRTSPPPPPPDQTSI